MAQVVIVHRLLVVSDVPQPTGPFGGFDLNQMLRFLQAGGPVHWEVARQVARWVALEGTEEVAVGDDDRARLLEVAEAAEAAVLADTGLPPAAGFEALTRSEWSDRSLSSLRPVLERLAVALQGEMPPADEEGNPLAGMFGALGPLLLGVQCGFMVGQLAQGMLSQHDLLLPVAESPRPTFVVPNLEAFHTAWSIPADDLRYYISLQEAVRSRISAQPWVRDRLVRLASEYVGSFRVDPSALESQLSSLDLSDPTSLEGLVRDPDTILGAMQTPEQFQVLERLQSTTAILESYADNVVERVGGPMLGSLGTIREAMRRHRITRSEADRFIQRLLGLDPSRRAHEQAAAFCAGVVGRAGPGALSRLLEGEHLLPTPSELEAPGLWLARLELDDGGDGSA
jgi:putative hydrolase